MAGRPRQARLSGTTIRKHKHLLFMWCLCFRIVVSLHTAAEGRRAASLPAAVVILRTDFVSFVFIVSFVFTVGTSG